TQFRAQLTSATSASSTDAASVTESARNLLEQTASVLNTQYSGSYLFGGSETKTAPVDVSSTSYAAATSPSTADTSYYHGDSQLASVRVSDSQTVSYGVSADNIAFEKLMRAMNLVASNSPLSSDTLNEALDLAVEAVDELGSFKRVFRMLRRRSRMPVPIRPNTCPTYRRWEATSPASMLLR
ncbi:MAG TPA: hypothetical protein VNQ74_13740, partial [Burkholderiaceae bacterium]|nr:hypothetical protein [Burkholderiaceae bacterium]